jgi:hypothetical protein
MVKHVKHALLIIDLLFLNKNVFSAKLIIVKFIIMIKFTAISVNKNIKFMIMEMVVECLLQTVQPIKLKMQLFAKNVIKDFNLRKAIKCVEFLLIIV